MFRLILIYVMSFGVLLSNFYFSADKKYPGFTWYIKGGAVTFDMLDDRDNDSLILGKNLTNVLAEHGLKIDDEVPILYPKDPYATLLKFDKKAIREGWMTNKGIFLADKASQLFDVRSMSVSDWRKTIFFWQTDIIEKKIYDTEMVSSLKEFYSRVHKLPEMSDKEFFHKELVFSMFRYLPDIYDTLPLDGSYRMCLSRIAKAKSQELFGGTTIFYLKFLVDSDNMIHGFQVAEYYTENCPPFKRMKKIGLYIPNDSGLKYN